MKKVIVFFLSFTVLFTSSSFSQCMADDSIIVTLPDFDVSLNAQQTISTYRKYPLVVYKNITYFPMTYYDAKLLGLSTKWNKVDGLSVDKNEDYFYEYVNELNDVKNSSKQTSKIITGKIKVNGKEVDNTKEPYPLLLFRDVTYFPLTWRFAVDEFGWEYHFDSKNGLVINSGNIVPKILELRDYLIEGTYNGAGQFILDGNYIYYAGNGGAIYKAQLDRLENCKKIFDIPMDDSFSDGKVITYGYPYFDKKDNTVFFTYRLGGWSAGSEYKVIINKDGTTSNAKSSSSVGSVGAIEEGLLLNWATVYYDDSYHSHRTENYEKENYNYIIASNENIEHDLSKIYKLNKSNGELKCVSEKPTGDFKYRANKLYFVSNDKKLYSLDLTDEVVKLESEGPVIISEKDNYEIFGGKIYYINDDDNKIYVDGESTPVNSNINAKSILSGDNYILFKYGSFNPSTVVYDSYGKEIFKISKTINTLSFDSDTLAYLDETENKGYMVQFKSSRRKLINLITVLSHHRTYRSVYGGSVKLTF